MIFHLASLHYLGNLWHIRCVKCSLRFIVPQAAVRARYFSGRKSSATASCSGTSGKKLSRWQ